MHKHITLLQNNQDSIENIIKRFSKGKRRVLNSIIQLILKYRTACPSQSTLGLWAEITRVHSNRLLQELHEESYISIINRGVKKTCIYKLNQLFYSPTIAFRLRHLLPAIWLSWNLTLIAAAGADLSKNVTQLKVNLDYNIYIKSLANKQHNLSYLSTKRIVGDISHKIQNGWNENIKSIVRGEKVMEAMISPQIEAIKTLNLTLAGKIALMSFPDEAVLWADQTFARRKGILEPFGYFRNLCMRYCSENKIAVDWSLTTKLNNYHKIVEGSPFLEKKAVNKQPIASKATNYSSKTTNTHKQEVRKSTQEWSQPQTKRYGYMKMRIPYNPNETQATANYRAMLRAQNSLIEDDEPMPHRGKWPLVSREESDKGYAEFIKTGKIPTNIFNAARYVDHPLVKDEPPVTDYSVYEEDLNDFIIDL